MVLVFDGPNSSLAGAFGSGSDGGVVINKSPEAVFNGTDGYINLSGSTGPWDVAFLSGSSTVCGWVNLLKRRSEYFIAFNDGTGNLIYSFRHSNSGGDLLEVDIRNASAQSQQLNSGVHSMNDYVQEIGGVNPNPWVHVAWTYDGTSGSLYIDGIETASGAVTLAGGLRGSGVWASGSGFAYLGRTGSTYMSGSMRDWRMYDKKLADYEIGEVMNDTYNTTVPLHKWLLDEGGSTITDYGSQASGTSTASNITWDTSGSKLSQIGSGSASGSVTVSGGTWNLRDSTHLTFDGSGDIVSGASWDFRPDGINYSIALWVNPNSVSAGNQVFVNQAGKFIFRQSNKKLECKPNNNTNIEVDNVFTIPDKWYHVAMTFNSGSKLTKLYADGDLVFAQEDSTAVTSGAAVIYVGEMSDGSEDFQGEMSDIRLYDFELSANQVKGIKSGLWTGAPKMWWKLTEGAGTTITDDGTANQNGYVNGPTWVTPDYDMTNEGSTAGALQLASGSKLSAPQGTMKLGQVQSHKFSGSTFIHNSGTLLLDFNTGAGVDGKFYDYGNTYWNITNKGTGYSKTMYASTNNNTIVENQFMMNDGGGRMYDRWYFGSDTQSGTLLLSGGGWTGYGGTAGIFGVNELYPAVVTGAASETISMRTSTVEFSDVRVLMDWTTHSGSVAHNLSGNCEFAGITISPTDSINLKGNRLACNYLNSWDAPLSGTTAGSLVVTTGNRIGNILNAKSLVGGNLSGTNVIMMNTLTGNCTFTSMMDADKGMNNVMVNITNGAYTLKPGGNDDINMDSGAFIIGAGTFDSYGDGNNNWNIKNLYMVTGGSFKPHNDSVTISGGNFRQGGFIGEHTLDLDGTDYVALGDGMGTQTAVTLEAWVNPSEAPHENTMLGTNASKGGILSSNTPNKFRIKHEDVNDGYTDVDYNWEVDKWQHMCFTWDGTTGKAYANAKLLHEWALSGDPYDLTKAAIGSLATGSASWPWEGKIARGSFWKSALTSSEIRRMMFMDWAAISGSSIDQTKCVGWYEFSDDPWATTVADSCGSGNTGTLSDAGAWALGGTFTASTSTIIMEGTGEINKAKSSPLDFYNLKVAQANGETTTLQGSKGGDDVNVEGTVYLNSGTFQDGSRYCDFKMKGADPFVSSGTTNFSNIMNAGMFGSVAQTVPEMTWNKCWYRTATGQLAGNQTIASGLRLDSAGGNLYTQGYDLTLNKIQELASGTSVVVEEASTLGFTHTDALVSTQKGTLLTSGAQSVKFTNEVGKAWPFEGQVSASGTLPASMNTASLASGTMSYWCKTPQIGVSGGGFDPIFSYKDNGNGWGILIYNNYSIKKIIAYIEDDNNSGYSWQQGVDLGAWNSDHSAYWSDTGWNHLMMTFESGQAMQFWLNGVGYSNETYTDAPGGGMVISGAIDSSNAYISLGARGLVPLQGSYMSGSVADVRIYHKALTSGNMVTLYNGGVCPASSSNNEYPDADNALGAAAWWKCNATGAISGYDGINKLDEVSGAAMNGWRIASETPAAYSGSNIESGFVSITGAAGFNLSRDSMAHNTQTEFTNTYISGSSDIIIPISGTLLTKGKVVIE